MSADFTPTMEGYSNQGQFRFWCQKVLPLVYDDSLSYYELLNKVVVYLNNTISDVAHMGSNVNELLAAYELLQNYVNTYFDNLDVQNEINNKLDEMAEDGTLTILIRNVVGEEAAEAVTDWMDEHLTPTTPIVDNSLTISGAAADSKTVGDNFFAQYNRERADKLEIQQAITEATNVEFINLEVGAYVAINNGVADVDNPVVFGNAKYTVDPCTVGEQFIVVNGLNMNSTKCYAFLDESNNVLESANTSPFNGAITAPNGTAYILFNWFEEGTYYFKGHKVLTETDKTLTLNGVAADAESTGNKINELKSTLYSENIFNTSMFENGAIDVANGNSVNSSSRIRTKSFLPWSVTTIGSTTSKGFLLYAWDKDGNYVGGWKNGSFGDDVAGVYSLDMTSFCRNPAFSGYKYKIVVYSAQIDTITGVYINNLSIENLFARGAILSLNNVTILPNGTDFNTLTTAGNYSVENYSQISTHTNTPPDVTTGGRLFVYYDIGNTRPVQVWISFDRYNEPLIWIRRMATNWTKWSKVGAVQPVNLRVLGYNIGAFNWGQSGGLAENVDEKIANYKRFFGSVNPDIMLFAEMATNIDSSGTYPSDSTLLAPLFVKRANFHQNAAATNLINAKTLESDGGIYLRNNNNEYAGAVGRLVCDVYNKKLIMSGGFLRVLSTAQDRLEAFQNYLTAIADYDYSVIYLDTNAQDDAERQNIYNAAVSAGYQVCNGGYFGLLETLVPTSMYKPIDNIFVKGNVKIKNFYVASTEYENLSSDHIPVIADLTLY